MDAGVVEGDDDYLENAFLMPEGARLCFERHIDGGGCEAILISSGERACPEAWVGQPPGHHTRDVMFFGSAGLLAGIVLTIMVALLLTRQTPR